MKKNINIEILRCISIIAVIVIHTSVPYFYNQDLMHHDMISWGIINFYYTNSRFGVPIFFLISAYLYFNSNKPFDLAKRIKRILLPYFAWSIIYWYFDDQHTITSFFIKIFCETSQFHLWFLVAFLSYSIFLPMLMSFSKSPDRDIYRPIVLTAFIFSIVLPSCYQFLSIFGFETKHIFSLFINIPQMFVFALVLPFILKKMNVVYCILLYIVLVIANMALNMFTAYHMGSPDEYWYLYTTLFVFVSSLLFFNLFINADFSFIKGRFVWLILRVGECSLGIYLCHYLVIEFLTSWGFLNTSSPIIGPLMNTFIVFIVSFLICLGCRRIKYIKEAF